MPSPRLSGFFLAAVAACAPPATDATDVAIASADAAPPPPPSSEAAGSSSTAPVLGPSPADPMAELARRFPDQEVLSIARWTRALPNEDVVAVVVRRRDARDDRSDVSWMRPSETGLVPALRTMPIGVRKLAHLDAVDVDADATSELLVFGEGTFGSVTVLHLAPGVEQPIELGAASAALDGCATVDEVEARLPLTAPLDTAKLASVSAAAFVGRLALAKPGELRSVIGKKGLELCSSVRSSGEKWSKKCRVLAGAKLSDEALESEVAQRLRNAFAPGGMGFECADARCTANLPGMTSLSFELEGAGASRRLSKIEHRDANIGE